ncbi:MAG: hypothetical protein AAFW74_01335, partial [Pseudomonadota bacterium]
LSSSSQSLASLGELEALFAADLDGDGTIGTVEAIEDNGDYQLSVTPGNVYEISNGIDSPVTLTHSGADVGPARYAGWTALQAEATDTGFAVLWQGPNDAYSLWQTDANGAYLSSSSQSLASLGELEQVFAADLDGNGQIGTFETIEENGDYQLSVTPANAYEISDGDSTSVTLTQGATSVGPTRYAGWSALQAEATDSGFAVLWQGPNDIYNVWQTDANGAYQSSSTHSSDDLVELEALFAADLDGDGTIGVDQTPQFSIGHDDDLLV